ncbi:hypothetical protein CBM2592_A10045 [Cupriavidus taiwanensis]|nr:hypothetical protein CBM2588_A10043 [Cupriavidus taiwanensis]SOY42329.1 hypothetical protein CBM2592_A10045 [Cupriavidus taiwanensis]SOZ20679.1 hypothetical protein CBM2608_A10040 [Cupriavidus taiwanensis]SPA08027.1 hypothetical protein CBM2631_A10044 [Cupriavidus taiwanensis]SPA25310.1 hypothetical protein CBM2623_A10044 [Cupriavidus taiwanensis]
MEKKPAPVPVRASLFLAPADPARTVVDYARHRNATTSGGYAAVAAPKEKRAMTARFADHATTQSS